MSFVRLTAKEVARASQGITIVVRPQESGVYKVMAVRFSIGGLHAHGTRVSRGGTMIEGCTEIAKTKKDIPAATKEVARWLSKLGFPCPMADASRHRRHLI